MKRMGSAQFDDTSVNFDFEDGDFDIQAIDDRCAVVFFGGRRYDVVTCFDAGRWHVLVNGLATRFVLEDERSLRRVGAGLKPALTQTSGDVKTPMPGRVVKVLVGVGDSVQKGQGVIVVEAMKMENEFKASCTGVVTEILVKPGETVEAGKVLVRINA